MKNEKIKSKEQQHGCIECYLANGVYTVSDHDIKYCSECGGKVLTLQELLDTIAELKTELEYTRTYYGISISDETY